jgi:hypothetical protein
MFSFLAVFLIPNDWNIDLAINQSNAGHYALVFVFYLMNYFIVIFFNMALMHCARIYFQGGKPTVAQGISFSMSRLNVIFGWALLSANVGLVLKMIQEAGGKVGEILSALLGIAWSIVTFFVVPVIAYENIGPLAAIKRSTSIMKENWGESLSASFSFFLAQLLGFLIIVVPLFILGMLVHIWLGVILAVAGLFILGAIISAAETIFISALYQQKVNNQPVQDFDPETIDHLFIKKEKKGIFG